MNAAYHSTRSPDPAIDGSTRPAFSTGTDARPVHFNQAWLDLRGTTLEEELARSFDRLVHPEDAAALFDAVTRTLARNAPVLVEFRVPDAAGRAPLFLGVVVPREASDAGPLPKGVAVHAVSDDERLRVEGAVREYAAVTRATAAGVVVSDPDLRIRSWNEGARRLLGYAPAEVIGRYPDMFADDEALTRLHAARERLLRGEPSTDISLRLRRADGVYLSCEALFSPVPGPENGVAGVMVVFHDVTARKLDELARHQAEDELRQAHRDIEALLRTLPAPVAVVRDADGVVVDANEAFAALCGMPAGDIVGLPVTRRFKYWNEGGDELLDYTLRRLRRGGSFACRLRRSGGAMVELSVTAQPLVFMNQAVYAVHCADLTRQKNDKRTLAAAASALNAARAAKTDLLARVGRELRTPLNGVLGGLELALETPDLPGDLRVRLERIQESARALVAVSNDLIDASNHENVEGELVRIPFDLADVLADGAASARLKAAEKGVLLYLHTEPSAPGRLYGDPDRLRQILTHLLANAVRFTDAGVVKLMAEAEERPGDRVSVHFTVADSGAGMDSDVLRGLLRGTAGPGRAFRASGLSATQALVERMGGRLHGESAPGRGTRFDFALDFDLDRQALADVRPAVDAGDDRPLPRFSGSALVAEDDAVNREVVEERLRRAGLDVTLAANGVEAVEAADRRLATGGGFDIVFMDIQMPLMDGLEATRRLRALGLKAPVIALTANVRSTDRRIYREQGLDGYLPKPFDARELRDCLAEHLEPLPVAAAAAAAPALCRPAGVDDGLHDRVRRRFLEEYRDAARRLDGFDAEGDRASARLLVHSIKSAAAFVGAAELSACAARLETGYRDAYAADTPPDASERRRFVELLDACLAALTAAAASGGTDAPALGGENPPPAAHSGLNRAVEAAARLARHLAAGDPRGFEDAQDLADALGRDRADVTEILRRVGDYDFEEARVLLDRLRAGLGTQAETEGGGRA